MYKLPERPYDIGQEDNVEEDDKEDWDSEEPGMALEVHPYIWITTGLYLNKLKYIFCI